MAVDLLAKRDIREAIIPVDATSITKTAGVGWAWSTYGILITAANMTSLFPGGFILCGAYVYEQFSLEGADGTIAAQLNIQVAKGDAGSEITVAEGHGVLLLAPGGALNVATVTGVSGRTVFFEPVLIPTGTRLAYRATVSSAKAMLVSVYLFGYDARYFAQPLKAVDELRYIRGLCSPTQGATVWPSPGASGSTAVTTHATTAWSYGTAVQFIASAACPLLITGLIGTAIIASNRVQARIGIGAAGSEQWMSKVGLPCALAAPGPLCDCYLPRPLYVKTGEAVSVVIAGSLANTVTNIALKGYALK